MADYSKRSSDNLGQAHPDLQTLFYYVIKYIDNSVICGYRGEQEQNKAFADGNSKLKFPQSKHNKTPSLAVDVVPYPIDWDDEERFKIFGQAVLGIADLLRKYGLIENKIEWGGNWKWKDYPHFQIKT